MYQQPDPALIALYMAMEGIAAVAYVLFFVWLAAKTISFLVCIMSHDGGMSRKEQIHRHRLENLTACMSFAGYVTGIVMLINAPAEGGPFKITLPGDIVIENAGVPVIVLAVAMSILWMVLNAKRPGSDKGETSGPTNPIQGRAGYGENSGQNGGQGNGQRSGGGFGPMTYWKAAAITAVLLPFINVFAIPVGIVLAVKVAKQNQYQPLPRD